ncbi:GPI transamidase-like protein component Gpi16 [Saitoella complicata NRRL Y-17804]|nr:GPI transamidase-like protein component Gpi16 [Saitoella complicata NRRL Y-17804]ODQ53971.1 GPI transamidase-like protein component Gpi16 [Saitoella complicata NRRL Y-17804]
MALALVLLLGLLLAHGATAFYAEHLQLSPLPANSVLASFSFQTNGSISCSHYDLLPRPLAQVLQHTQTKELHLSFLAGRWDDQKWGALPDSGHRTGGNGVELWAVLEAPAERLSEKRWLELNQALSGLFCASLNTLDMKRTIRPIFSFQPEGAYRGVNESSLHVFHGALPRETVCTENLTPFLKLLPCKGRAGISALLDGRRIFDAQFQSMSITVLPTTEAGGVSVTQQIDVVIDVSRTLRKRASDNGIIKPRPGEEMACDEAKGYHNGDTCFPVENRENLGWSLEEIFGKSVPGRCPFAREHAGRGDVSYVVNKKVDLEPQPLDWKESSGRQIARYSLEDTTPFTLLSPQHPPSVAGPPTPPPILASRSLTHHTPSRAGMHLTLHNPSPSSPLRISYLESLPWFLKPYMHTFHTSIPGVIEEMYFLPAKNRERGTHLEILVTIPAGSTVEVDWEFEKYILRYIEYPSDANRGFDIAPAVITVLPTDTMTNDTPYQMRTTSLLLTMPTPDFSMPYNVIILTSTVLALAFGSIFNLLVRRFVLVKDIKAAAAGAGVKKPRVSVLKRIFGKLKRKKE